MTSKLAKQQIEQWWKEGLKPTVEDIVLVNNLGLQVERGSDMFNFSACPRAAFLGDNILWEPTLKKRMWIDAATQVVDAESMESKIYVLAYALATPNDELAPLTKTSKLKKDIVKFRDEVLVDFTDTQIVAAIDWCLNGIKPDLEVKELKQVMDVPDEDGQASSIAKQLLLEAISDGMSDKVQDYALLDDLKNMIVVAAMYKGVDVLKNEHTKNAGRFYVACGKIHTRLLEEKENGKG